MNMLSISNRNDFKGAAIAAVIIFANSSFAGEVLGRDTVGARSSMGAVSSHSPSGSKLFQGFARKYSFEHRRSGVTKPSSFGVAQRLNTRSNTPNRNEPASSADETLPLVARNTDVSPLTIESSVFASSKTDAGTSAKGLGSDSGSKSGGGTGFSSNASVTGTGLNASVTGTGLNASVTGTGLNASVTGTGLNASVTGTGLNASVTGTGLNASVTGTGLNASVTGTGLNASVTGTGLNASVTGTGLNASVIGTGLDSSVVGTGLGNWEIDASVTGTGAP